MKASKKNLRTQIEKADNPYLKEFIQLNVGESKSDYGGIRYVRLSHGMFISSPMSLMFIPEPEHYNPSGKMTSFDKRRLRK